jgi:hypothetical protein
MNALAVRLLRLQPEAEPLAHHGGQEGAYRVRLPAVERVTLAMVAPLGLHSSASRLLRIRLPRGLTAAAHLRTDLGCRPRLTACAQVCAWTCKTPLKSVGATSAPEGSRNSAPPPPKPRGGLSALAAVRGASRSGSASVLTTHALFAREVQRKLSNGIAAFRIPAFRQGLGEAGYVEHRNVGMLSP